MIGRPMSDLMNSRAIFGWLSSASAENVVEIGKRREAVTYTFSVRADGPETSPVVGFLPRRPKAIAAPRFVSTAAASEYSGLSVQRIGRLIRAGRVEADKVGHRYQVDWRSFLALLAEFE